MISIDLVPEITTRRDEQAQFQSSPKPDRQAGRQAGMQAGRQASRHAGRRPIDHTDRQERGHQSINQSWSASPRCWRASRATCASTATRVRIYKCESDDSPHPRPRRSLTWASSSSVSRTVQATARPQNSKGRNSKAPKPTQHHITLWTHTPLPQSHPPPPDTTNSQEAHLREQATVRGDGQARGPRAGAGPAGAAQVRAHLHAPAVPAQRLVGAAARRGARRAAVRADALPGGARGARAVAARVHGRAQGPDADGDAGAEGVGGPGGAFLFLFCVFG